MEWSDCVLQMDIVRPLRVWMMTGMCWCPWGRWVMGLVSCRDRVQAKQIQAVAEGSKGALGGGVVTVGGEAGAWMRRWHRTEC